MNNLVSLQETLAIDFGTTNSTVFYYKNRKYHAVPAETYGLSFLKKFDPDNPLFPSYVEYDGDKVIVGAKAKKDFGQPNKFVIAFVKRILGLTKSKSLGTSITRRFAPRYRLKNLAGRSFAALKIKKL